MELYTERHGMRTPIEKTYIVSVSMYSLLYDCCARYFEYLAWKYPMECPDGNGCCGFDPQRFNEDMTFEIPNLFRREGNIDKPRMTYCVFETEPRVEDFDQYALLDLIEFVAQNIKDITRRSYHSFFRHDDLTFGATNETAGQFIDEINAIFQKVGLLYQLTTNLQVERIEEAAVLTERIVTDIEKVKEKGLRELLITAVEKHKSPDPNDQKDAVEKLWDALERLKTYYVDKDKKESVNQIIMDMSNGQEEYKRMFESEFRELTNIGNDYRIRHHETSRIEITDIRHYDYFFNRCLALIGTAIQYLK